MLDKGPDSVCAECQTVSLAGFLTYTGLLWILPIIKTVDPDTKMCLQWRNRDGISPSSLLNMRAKDAILTLKLILSLS